MKKYLEFCEMYSYPIEVKKHFEIILSQIDKYLNLNKIKSIILIGSTARGELSYIINEKGNLDIFSDYEFVIVSNYHFASHQIQTLKEQFKKNKNEWGIKNPLFHIDFGIFSPIKWRLNAMSIWTYELKSCGFVIYGEKNILKTLPDINISNIDLGNTNELILVRLWMQLLNIPINIIEGKADNYEKYLFRYFLARNILDILTIFLPNKGILFSSYSKRVNYFKKNYHRLFLFQDNKSAIVFDEALKLKLYLKSKYSLKWYYKYMLKGYIQLINNLTRSNIVFDNFSEKNLHEISINIIKNNNFLKDKSIKKTRRWISEIKMLKVYCLNGNTDIIKFLLWFKVDKRPWIINFLIYMHIYLYNYLFENDNCKEIYLDRASYFLSKFNIVRKDNNYYNATNDGIQRWKILRNEFNDFMIHWFYRDKLISQKEVSDIIEWRNNG